jgi:cytosine/adenosine deaminase-related metal-dependent hydrolase
MGVVLQGGRVATLLPPGLAVRDVDLGGSGTEAIDVHGCLVLPGLVLAHTHLYSALARGMPAPVVAPSSFVEILERVWWRLDCALDEESLRASAEVALSEAALAGVTTLFDHHESPRFIDGSLDVLADAAAAVGIRVVLCYGATDRHGHADALRGIAESVRLGARAAGSAGRLGAMVGLHASFTVDDATLTAARLAMDAHGLGLHVHAAEDAIDRDAIARLDHFGLLGDRTLLAHAVHASAADRLRVRETGAFVVHNPRSNLHNAVGIARLGELAGQVALGTDGMDGDLFAELRAAHLVGRSVLGPAGGVDAVGMLAAGDQLADRVLGPRAGDAVVLEYDPPTPLEADNLAGHLLFGIGAVHVRDVFVAGESVVRDRALVKVDQEALRARARTRAAMLWRRMAS